MRTLTGNKVYLRALEPTDLDFLYLLENDEMLWEVSNTLTPYSKFVLQQYLDNAHRDMYEVKQLRLAICLLNTTNPIGFIDLYDFNPTHKRAGVGIVVFSENNKQKGFAKEALQLLIRYCFTHLGLHQLYAGISEDNNKSIGLFEKTGFTKTGERKDWILSNRQYKTEYFYQLIYE